MEGYTSRVSAERRNSSCGGEVYVSPERIAKQKHGNQKLAVHPQLKTGVCFGGSEIREQWMR
jgi:hypothetical protein